MGANQQYNTALQAEDQNNISSLLLLIHNEYHSISNYAELETAIRVSSIECTRLFRKYLKMTPMEYIRQYRIKMACQLLTNTDLTVTEISERCNMNASYLSKKVRETTGFSPLEYRRNHLRKQYK